nr:hypothetical protein [Tanacetum cinerariifolium]
MPLNSCRNQAFADGMELAHRERMATDSELESHVAQQLPQPSLRRWRGTDPSFSSAMRDYVLNQTSYADSYGPSSSFQTRKRTSPENQISPQVHAQFNATTADTATGTNVVAPQSLNMSHPQTGTGWNTCPEA